MRPDETVFLRPDVVIEPLVMRWRAWSHLISPATAALHVTKRHIDIMRSFIHQPQVHRAAARTPELAGGPFIDLDPSRTSAVAQLLTETQEAQKPLFELAEALTETVDMLRRAPRDDSLEPLYLRIPEPLRGLIELVRDAQGQAGFRLFEALLYSTSYYQKRLQSVVFRRLDPDRRPFVLSTPDVEEDGALHLARAFDSPELELILESAERPCRLGDIAEAIGCDASDARLRDLFWTTPPSVAAPYDGGGVRVRYFGHATLLIEHAGVSVLTDPIVSAPTQSGAPRYGWSDLPAKIDHVLITHNHKDHFCLESLLRLRGRVVGSVVVPANAPGGLADPSMKLVLEACGFHNVVELHELDALTTPGGRILGVPFLGEHGDLDIRSKIAFLIELGSRRVLVAADSNNLDTTLYARLRAVIGDVDTIFISLECAGAPLSWLYGPLLPGPLRRDHDQSRRLSASDDARAAAMIDALGCRDVKIYAMGLEPWLRFLTGVQYPDDSIQMRAAQRLCEALSARGLRGEICRGMGEWIL